MKFCSKGASRVCASAAFKASCALTLTRTLGGREWLTNIIHRTNLKALHLIDGIGLCGEEDDRDVTCVGVCFQPAADLETVHTWHHYIE